MDFLKRLTNYRFAGFLVVNAEAVVLNVNGTLESVHTAGVLITSIGAFIAAQAWEKVKGVSSTTGE